jgi:hypothetical protein
VVGRLVAPPPAPVRIPFAPNRAEHVAAHDVCATAHHQLVARGGVRLVTGLAGVPVPFVKLQAADANRVVAVLLWTGDEAIDGDGHVACSSCHTDQDHRDRAKSSPARGPGRYPLGEGASLALGWLVDRLTGGAYYDAEVYFVATRDNPNIEFGGPVDNLTDAPTGLVVSLRVFGELAYRVTDPSVLLARLIGTGAGRLQFRDINMGRGPDVGGDQGRAARHRCRARGTGHGAAPGCNRASRTVQRQREACRVWLGNHFCPSCGAAVEMPPA